MNAQGPENTNPDGLSAMPTEQPRREASLVLREDNVREQRAVSMEAANKSLADALRFTYRIIQVLMIVLAGLFIFSGFQQVNEGETGLRVEFGKLKGGALSSGFHFSLPYPMGQMEIVDTRQQSLEIDTTFWPQVRDKTRGLEQLGTGGMQLNIGTDGSLITGDGNIVHTQWSVLYRREQPVDFAANVHPDTEDPLVRAVVERAVVQVVSEITIDELLKPSSTNAGDSSIESRVRRLSQGTLDRLATGIRIDESVLRHKSPPVRVRADFESVNKAIEQSNKQISDATSDRSVRLTSLVGTAYTPLIDLIDEMENATALGEGERAERILETIREVFDSRHNRAGIVEIAGKTYTDVRFSGSLSTLINTANQQRSVKIANAKAEAQLFRAQLKQYRANPSVFLSTEYANAWSTMLDRKNVSVFWAPPGTDPLVWKLTTDPEHEREIEREIKRLETLRAHEERVRTLDTLKDFD